MYKEELIYLACPFYHIDIHIRESRVEVASRFASDLMRKGVLVFCPLAHNLAILRYGLPIGWDYWERFDKNFLRRCDRLYVLKLEGWRHSSGVQGEIRIARELNMPIEYHAPDFCPV